VKYDYTYNYKWYDYDNVKHLVAPDQVPEEEHPTYTEVVEYKVYKDGEGHWVRAPKAYTTEIDVFVKYYSIIVDNVRKYTEVSAREYPGVVNCNYIYKDTNDAYLIVDATGDAPVVYEIGDATTKMADLKLKDGNTRTNQDWIDLYNDWVDNKDADQYSTLSYGYNTQPFADASNPNNVNIVVKSETADGTNGKPNHSDVTVTYQRELVEDKSSVYSVTLSNEPAADEDASIVKLEKKKLVEETQAIRDKINLSKIPSTL